MSLRAELEAFAEGALRLELDRLATEMRQDTANQLQPLISMCSQAVSSAQPLVTPVVSRDLAVRRRPPQPLGTPETRPATAASPHPWLNPQGSISGSSHEWTTRRPRAFGQCSSGRVLLSPRDVADVSPTKGHHGAQESLGMSASIEDVTKLTIDSPQKPSNGLEPRSQAPERTVCPLPAGPQLGGLNHAAVPRFEEMPAAEAGKLPPVREAWTPLHQGQEDVSPGRRSGRQSPDSMVNVTAGRLPRPFHHARADREETLPALEEADRCGSLHFIVKSVYFDYVIGVLVFLNAVLIGVQVDHTARHHTETVPATFRICEIVFCGVFSIEIFLRIMVYRSRYFFKRERCMWFNIFDFVMVTAQVIEEVMIAACSARESLRMNITFMRCLRVLRSIRVLRGARILRLVENLRILVISIQHAANSLAWTVVLLALVIFVCSVWFTQIVSDHEIHNHGSHHSQALRFYFGSLGSTWLSLYQSVTGGLDWRDAMQPLMTDISPVLGPIFCMYIAFVVLAMLNIVTGVFVDTAMTNSKEDFDLFMKNNISELFGVQPRGTGQTLHLQDFQNHLDKKVMQEYFKALDVDLSEAKGIFDLLDLTGSGSVDAEEFVSGIMRLRGPAKALELELVMHEVKLVHSEVSNLLDSMAEMTLHGLVARSPPGSTYDFLASALSEPPGQEVASPSTLRVGAAAPVAHGVLQDVEVPFPP